MGKKVIDAKQDSKGNITAVKLSGNSSFTPVETAMGMFLGLNVPDKVRFLDLLRNKIFTLIYFLMGLKYSDVEKILKEDADKSS